MKIIILLLTTSILLTNCQKKESDPSPVSTIKLPNTLHLTHNDLVLIKNQYPATYEKIREGSMLTIEDILAMHQSGFETTTMIGIIKYTNSQFTLNTKQIIELQNSGIPFALINYIIQIQ